MRAARTLVRVAELERMSYAALVSFLNDARSKKYGELAETLTLLIKDQKACEANPGALPTSREARRAFEKFRPLTTCSRGEDL
jgi:hypothetical protein